MTRQAIALTYLQQRAYAIRDSFAFEHFLILQNYATKGKLCCYDFVLKREKMPITTKYIMYLSCSISLSCPYILNWQDGISNNKIKYLKDNLSDGFLFVTITNKYKEGAILWENVSKSTKLTCIVPDTKNKTGLVNQKSARILWLLLQLPGKWA